MAQMDTKHTSGTLCNNSGAGSLWVFSCLAHSCAQFSVEEESSLFSTGIRLNVPDTVIFEGGSPRFWLCTHDGRLTRRDLCEHLVTSGGGGASQKSLKESSIDERINHAVEGMRSFWHRTNSKAASNTCIPACVVCTQSATASRQRVEATDIKGIHLARGVHRISPTGRAYHIGSASCAAFFCFA